MVFDLWIKCAQLTVHQHVWKPLQTGPHTEYLSNLYYASEMLLFSVWMEPANARDHFHLWHLIKPTSPSVLKAYLIWHKWEAKVVLFVFTVLIPN